MLLWIAGCLAGQVTPGDGFGNDTGSPTATVSSTGTTGSGGTTGSTGTSTTGSATGTGGTTGSTGTGGTTGSTGTAGTTGTVGTTGTGSPGLGVLTLNLHCLLLDGTGFATNEERMEAIAAWASAEGVQVLLLQEACDDGSTSAMALLEAALEAETGRDWSGAWAFAHVAWRGTPDEADEGVGILAAGPLADPRATTYYVQGGLQRVGLSALLPASLGGHRVHTVHLEVDDAAVRQAQARQAAATALVESDPDLDVLVGGDLNDVEGSPTWAAFTDLGFTGLDAGIAPTGIDHLFVHPAAGLSAAEVRVVLDGADGPVVSDHPGVFARLEPVGGAAPVLTRVTAHVDVGWGHWLALRGDVPPLSWDLGWPMVNLDAKTWRLVLPDLPGKTFAYKTLVDDLTWQAGADATGTVGADNEVWPTF